MQSTKDFQLGVRIGAVSESFKGKHAALKKKFDEIQQIVSETECIDAVKGSTVAKVVYEAAVDERQRLIRHKKRVQETSGHVMRACVLQVLLRTDGKASAGCVIELFL
ncbi:hypothetical protein HK104_003729 [Borealophlyctis nickersoniae]|nr:hypothetical protein HK104_003729 [Borealophlyctis nickersoniae]